jgi:hypothetical protein
MPSLLHEGLLELIRDKPELMARLLQELLHVDVPHFTEARLTDATLSQPLPAEFRADAVVLLIEGQPVFGCVVEAQLKEDERKLYSWPVYVATARARYECPFVLVVVTPYDEVASWAARPIELGGNQRYQPLVIGPPGIPVVTDPVWAITEPELAILSALAHGRGDPVTALNVTLAALTGVASLPADQQVLYFHLVRSAVGEAARKAFEMLPQRYFKYLTEEELERMRKAELKARAEGVAEGRAEGVAEGRAEGVAEGMAAALVSVLEGRGFTLPSHLREELARKPQQELAQLLRRAGTVERAEDLL